MARKSYQPKIPSTQVASDIVKAVLLDRNETLLSPSCINSFTDYEAPEVKHVNSLYPLSCDQECINCIFCTKLHKNRRWR